MAILCAANMDNFNISYRVGKCSLVPLPLYTVSREFSLLTYQITRFQPSTTKTTNNNNKKKNTQQKRYQARHQWLMPTILATQEAEIRRIEV
jgi:hypothetical protein